MASTVTGTAIQSSARELAFVDSSVADLEVLVKGMQPHIAVSVLSPSEPALLQMARAMARHQDVDVVHIIAHGQPGEVSFSSGAVSLETLQAHGDDLAAIGRSLSADGEIRLWVCDTAHGARGKAFVRGLAQATNVTVSASTGRIGAKALGGSWDAQRCHCRRSSARRAKGIGRPNRCPASAAAYGARNGNVRGRAHDCYGDDRD